MRFSTLAILSLPLAVLASPLPELEAEIEKRASDQYSSVLSSLNSVLSDTNTMNDQLNGFATTAKPNFFQLAALQNSGKALQTDLNSANSSATASSAFTTTEATALYTQLHDKLLPSVQTVMKNWVAHYPGVSSGGYASLIHDTLVKGEGMLDGVLAAIKKKTTSTTTAGKYPALKTNFDNAFNSAITKYAS